MTNVMAYHFPRPVLASQYAAAMMGETPFTDAPNGLFLAAPRRTGKSTFLQLDLRPELERRGVLVIYVDLWANQDYEPSELIAITVAEALEARRGLLHRAAKATGVESIAVAGIRFDTDKIGKKSGTTLHAALHALQQVEKRPIAFIIDEAQHTLKTEAGNTTMKALKSARDQMNGPSQHGLMLVMSGSDRDKLMRLVNNHDAAFFGSTVRDLPPLSQDFIAAIAALVEAQHHALQPVDVGKMSQAFQLFGHRPQFFMQAIGDMLSPLADQGGRFEDRLLNAAKQQQSADEAQMASDFLSLSALPRAVLWRILEKGARFRPYDAAALAFYQNVIGKKISPPLVKSALDTLRDRTPPLVWKSARGEYAVDDLSMHHWYERHRDAGTWPPGSG